MFSMLFTEAMKPIVIALLFSTWTFCMGISQAAPAPLPTWTSVEQLVTRYVFFHSGTYTQFILPARNFENLEPLSMMWCFSRADLSFEVNLVGSASNPVIPLVVRIEPNPGAPIAPYCYSTVVRNYTYREPSRITLRYLTSGPTLPFRGMFHDLSFRASVTHSQTISTASSNQFGILHLWTPEIELAKPTAAFVCLATTTPVHHGVFKSSESSVATEILAQNIGFGCYSFGKFSFNAAGSYTFDLFSGPGDAQPLTVASFAVDI